MLGNSVAVNHLHCAEAVHDCICGSWLSNCSTALSRMSNSESMSRSTRSLEAGATFVLLTIPKPLGVSTRSSDGTAQRTASDTTICEASILTTFISSRATISASVSSPQIFSFSHCSEAVSHGVSLSNKGVSPLAVANTFGIKRRSVSSFFISVIVVRFWIRLICYQFGITIFIKGRKHNKRTVGISTFPTIEANDNSMYGE